MANRIWVLKNRVWNACGELFFMRNPLIINKPFRVRLSSPPLIGNQRVTIIFGADFRSIIASFPGL